MGAILVFLVPKSRPSKAGGQPGTRQLIFRAAL